MPYHHRGWALAHAGKLDEALADLDKAADLVRDARIFTCRSRVHERLGNNVKAKDDFEKAIQLDANVARDPAWRLPAPSAAKDKP